MITTRPMLFFAFGKMPREFPSGTPVRLVDEWRHDRALVEVDMDGARNYRIVVRPEEVKAVKP